MGSILTASPHRLAPDLARLPITHNLRALSLAEGVRAALSVSIIIALSEFFHIPPLREAALGALLTCLCDPGGPVRRRVPVLLTFTLLGAAITGGFGLMRGFGIIVALPLGVLALFAASFARIYGQAAQQLGALLATVIVLSLDRGQTPGTALLLATSFAGGSLWAVLLTLVIWRLHPYRATRQAVAETYHALAALAGDLDTLLRRADVDDAAWEAHARAHRRAVREAIEAARVTVLDTLRARGAGGPRASVSLIRLETADQMFGALIALSDLLEHETGATRRRVERVLRPMRPLLTLLAGVALSDKDGALSGLDQTIDKMAARVATLPADSASRRVCDDLIERLRVADTLSTRVNFVPGADPSVPPMPLRETLLRPLRANLIWRSPVLRHASRAAALAAPALGFTMLWFSPYDHWLTITIVATMQPFFALTYARAFERIAGTALGGLIAAAVGLVCTTPVAIAVAMFPLAVAALAVRAVSFGLFMLALTPVVVLLVETGEPGTNEWRIALARAGFTVAGGILAVAASFILWPSREPERLISGARAAIAAHGRYAEAELSFLLGDMPESEVEPIRREAGVASNALEASLNRALIERGERDLLEAVLVIDAALRRCAGRLSAMQRDPGLRDALPPEALRAWRDWLGGTARALAAGEAMVPPRPAVADVDAIRRLARQVELIGGAMRRLAG